MLAATLSSAEAAAGATILDLALAEEIDPGLARRVLRDVGIDPGPIRKAGTDSQRFARLTHGAAEARWPADFVRCIRSSRIAASRRLSR
jgi:hypothetical protein